MAKKIETYPLKIEGGQPVCSGCGGDVQCTGVLNCSMVNVNADCYIDANTHAYA